jgi:hypothetical protein
VVGLRVSDEIEREGLDVRVHAKPCSDSETPAITQGSPWQEQWLELILDVYGTGTGQKRAGTTWFWLITAGSVHHASGFVRLGQPAPAGCASQSAFT